MSGGGGDSGRMIDETSYIDIDNINNSFCNGKHNILSIQYI